MQFRILGPVEVVGGGGSVALGGTKQRATLGSLLLQANRVVATSQLLNSLWEVDDAPVTARKILQNAIYGLRGVLSGGSADARSVKLLTQPPGYMLRVDPRQVDLYLFQQLVAEGRQQLHSDPEAASRLLHEALGLWRGPVLADLVEAGMEWPELAALEKSRLDATEDYVDAQLACGRHHAVLADLERMVQAEPLRERSCAQLMLALYRCGRQADALSLYGRVRSVLIEDLGLEPGRGLQKLQQAILTQDSALSLEPAGARAAATVSFDARGQAPSGRREPAPAIGGGAAHGGPSLAAPAAPSERCRTIPDAAPSGGAPQEPPRPVGTERLRVGVLSVRTRLAVPLGASGREDLDDLLDGAASVVRQQIERFGGSVTASIGSTTLALFGLNAPGEDDVVQAVRAALAVRDVLDVFDGAGADGGGLSMCAAVDMGEVLLRQRRPGDAPTIVGAVLDASQSLLSDTDAGEVRVSDAVRRGTEDVFVSVPTETPTGAGWQVIGIVDEQLGKPEADASARSYELDFLQELVRRTQRCSAPHLVTLLGERGSGKTRLLRDLRHRITTRSEPARCLNGRTHASSGEHPLLAQAQLLADYCGVRPGADVAEARAAVDRAVRSLAPSPPTASRMTAQLARLFDPSAVRHETGPVLEAWCDFFREAARRSPLVLCLDDVHQADDAVLRAVEELAESADGALVVVAAADPSLLRRRPTWAGGKSHATTVTLDRSEAFTNEQLVSFLLSAAGSALPQMCG